MASFEEKMKAFLLLLFLCLEVYSLKAEERMDGEAEALLQWKATLKTRALDDSWSPFNSMHRPCNWSGVSCNHNGSVVGINIRSLSLGGTLDFLSIPDLEVLVLSSDDLYGRIPPRIGSLPKLTVLDLSSNGFSGRLLWPISPSSLT
ncbi:unnamed protein product [Victoria cruziana]